MSNINEVTGRIFDIQRYSIHDGPGIRTIVFMKGCPLRCKWCCNPEGQKHDIQEMNFAGRNKIVGRDVTVSEVMEEIMQDLPYYRRSGGGITLSGGECLFQPKFGLALLEAAKNAGLSTAIETTGFSTWEIYRSYLTMTDHVLMDIKNINNEKHMHFCGQSNERILENARRAAEEHSDITIRVPVIPGFNDTEKEISDIAFFAKSLRGVKKLNLLPYHRLGMDKYSALGRKYELADLPLIEEEKMYRLLAAAEKSGLDCKIGG